jgi:hypothetical protein
VAVFYPSAQVRLQLRIDELADTAALEAALQREPPSGAALGLATPATKSGVTQSLQDNLARRQLLNAQRANMTDQELAQERSVLNAERDRLQRQTVNTKGVQDLPNAIDQGRGAQDNLTVIFSTLPISVEIERNGLKDADVCRVVLNYKDVPVDPRIIRACFVSVTLGTVTADEYSVGVTTQRLRPDGGLVSVVGRDPGQELNFKSSTRFTGFVDEWQVAFDDGGDQISLKCRDVSALLRDQKLFNSKGENTRIDMTKPIAEGVQEIIERFESTRGIKVVFGTPVDPNDPLAVLTPNFGPTPDGTIPAAVTPRTLKARKGKQKRVNKKQHDQSLWDHITDVTLRLGLVPCLRSFTLFLLEPRVVFSDLSSARRMVWGRNIKRLEFSRRMGGLTKSDTIEVRSADPTIGRTRWARHPVLKGEPKSGILGQPGSPQPVTSRANNVGPNGVVDESVKVLSVRGVSDLKVLERIAENAFNEICRQEIEGSVETDEISSFESQEEGDLLSVMPGEAMQILVAPPAEVSTPGREVTASKPGQGSSNLQLLQAQSVAERQRYLTGLGISRESAARLAVAQEKVHLISSFRVGQLVVSWSVEDGVAVSASFYNFVVVRDAPGDAVGRSATPKNMSEAAGRVNPKAVQ